MKQSMGNAALLAFAANLLDTDAASSAVPPRPSSLRRPAPVSSRHRGAFVPQESGAAAWARRRRGRPSSSSSDGGRASAATTAPRTWRQRSSSARLARPAASSTSTVTPRRYVEPDALGSEEKDVEFSLLRPHLEFSELELHELFSSENRAGSTGLVSGRDSVDSTPASGSSQLYEELEEVEIGHFQPPQHLEEAESGAPFFFASPLVVEGQDAKDRETKSTDDPKPTEPKESEPQSLPPWLSLNRARFAPIKLRKLQKDLSSNLSSKEIQQVVRAIYAAAGNDTKTISGAADFCSILVNSLEMTDAPALCAAAFHYSSLMSVRERELDPDGWACSVEEGECLRTAGPDAKYLCRLAGSGIEEFGTHAVKIALDAARLKSMETLAATVVRKNGKPISRLTPADARNLRSLLLTVNEEGDWRALAIRSAASLYRLEGLEAHRALASAAAGGPRRTRAVSPEESRASREALHIYAPLAAQLGMFRLKTELEDAAFRTLYPRSHAKVSALCGGENTNSVGEGMRSVLDDISHQTKRLVQEDCKFMENIVSVGVTARVKEPYSVWRKMLKISREAPGVDARSLSILDIPDAVAARVVFQARKLRPDETDATTQRRERELCYHLLDLCERNWPQLPDSRFKDYVKNPKDNGYRSLHYSSRQRWRGTSWPFEVQIRSREMHRVAEYGVAAHWSYKRRGIEDDDDAGCGPLDPTSEAYLRSVQQWRRKQLDRARSQAPEQDPSLPTKTVSSRGAPEEPSMYIEEEIRRQRKRDRDETLAPYLEALSGAQTDMTRENVFLFVSVQPPRARDGTSGYADAPPAAEGTVLSLPAGSRVLDAIRVTERWSSTLEASGQLYDGRNDFVALRNGIRTSSLGTELLASGDVVSILPVEELVSSARKGGGGASAGSPFFQ